MKMLTGLALLAVTLLYCPQTGLAARTPKAQVSPVWLAVSALTSSENSSPLTLALISY